MAIPNAPVTRGEVYLDAIATGDASGLPAYPVTREEQYLDAIAKNGGGGSGGGVLLVHDVDGTLDKTWQEIVDADYVVIKAVDGTDIFWFSAINAGQYGSNPTTYYVGAYNPNNQDPNVDYVATSADGYPATFNPGTD